MTKLIVALRSFAKCLKTEYASFSWLISWAELTTYQPAKTCIILITDHAAWSVVA